MELFLVRSSWRRVRSAVDIVGLMAAEKGIELRLDLADDLPSHIQADEKRLSQVLINLLGNAVKFTHFGGVTLAVRSMPRPDGAAGQVLLRFDVRDTGVGIAEDQIEQLFQPFRANRRRQTAPRRHRAGIDHQPPAGAPDGRRDHRGKPPRGGQRVLVRDRSAGTASGRLITRLLGCLAGHLDDLARLAVDACGGQEPPQTQPVSSPSRAGRLSKPSVDQWPKAMRTSALRRVGMSNQGGCPAGPGRRRPLTLKSMSPSGVQSAAA